jgi:cobyrinic acid a,c-diamide synthase
MAAFRRRGLAVAPFKVGPDFIDPGHHARITGAVSRNLDGWMLPRSYNMAGFARASAGADVAVIEGVMGLFDGYDGRSEAGSTAEMAKWTGVPVVLVVDARSMARSAAALVHGFERFDPDLDFAGVIFNNVGSRRHLDYLREALEGRVKMPCLGGIPRDDAVAIPERHLGLVTREEHEASPDTVRRLADLVEHHVDLDALLDRLPPITGPAETPSAPAAAAPPAVRLGMAADKAFCFYYQDNLDLLAARGAEIVPFSPISDPSLPEDLDGLYFGGGYPELFAGPLAGNAALRRRIREQSLAGMPIYGECGGFMYLGREIRDTEGQSHPMVGCFPFATRMYPRLRSLGYREVSLAADTVIGPAGTTLRGHEFHYSGLDDIVETGKWQSVYAISDRTGRPRTQEGYQTRRTLGSYVHLHFGSCPDAAGHFVKACRTYRHERNRPR